MAVFVPDLIPSAEAHRARSRPAELPRCDGLRQCAAAMAITHLFMTSRVAEFVDLGPVVQAGFALTGFALAGFLLRGRAVTGGPMPDDSNSKVKGLLRSLPVDFVVGVVAVILYLPRFLALEDMTPPNLGELPALIERWLKWGIADFLGGSFDKGSLIAWPLFVLLAPRRLLGSGFLALLGAGLTVQFSSLMSGEVRPASILVGPSPLDLLAAGSLLAAICQGVGRSGDRRLARWALVMGLALAAASFGSRFESSAAQWGTSALLWAPPGFGAVNFILKIVATTLVGSLAWRDIGH